MMVKCECFRKLQSTTNIPYFDVFQSNNFILYIRVAGGPLFHRNRCLSLLIYGACRYFFAPTHLKSNDK